jgi:hypothetical protein
MNAKNENRLNMYLVVVDYINAASPTTIAAMPDFANIFNRFNNDVQLLRTKSESQTSSRIGYRILKTSGKQDLTVYAIYMADCITAYALSVNDLVLLEQMKFTKSDLLKQRDTKTADDAQFILTKAIEFLTNLTPFGILQSQVDDLNDLIIAFNTNIPLPRVNINKRKLLTKEIEDLIVSCDAFLIRMDKLVNILQLNDETFYTEYYFSRKIVNNHGRKLSLRGYVYDTLGNPINKVKVTVNGLNKETKTTDRGYYEFKNLPAGMQSLTFTQVDYQTLNTQAGIITGERADLNITMEEIATQQNVA